MKTTTENNTTGQIEIDNDWLRVGVHTISVLVPLSDAEKIELGEFQANTMKEVDELEAALDGIKKEYKNKIDTANLAIRKSAIWLREGQKPVDKTLPCYFDPRGNMRLYIDTRTGEIVETRPAEPSDRQLRLNHD